MSEARADIPAAAAAPSSLWDKLKSLVADDTPVASAKADIPQRQSTLTQAPSQPALGSATAPIPPPASAKADIPPLASATADIPPIAKAQADIPPAPSAAAPRPSPQPEPSATADIPPPASAKAGIPPAPSAMAEIPPEPKAVADIPPRASAKADIPPVPTPLSKSPDTTSVVGSPETKAVPTLWDKLKAAIPSGDPEATAAAEVSKTIEPTVTKLIKPLVQPSDVLERMVDEPQAIAREKQRLGRPLTTGEAVHTLLTEGPALELAGTFGGSTIGRGPGTPPPFRQRTTPLPPGQPPGATDLARGLSHAIETTVSPTTVDTAAEMAEASINKSLGEARQATEQAHAQFTNDMRKMTAPQIPEFQEYVHDTQQGRAAAAAQGVPYVSNLPKPAALRFLDYVEGRSVGAKLDPDIAHMQTLADTMRQIVQDRERAIAADPLTNVTSFIDDYYSHQWAEKARVPTLLYGTRARMGSGTSLKQRRIPTISEGIEAGLTPTSFDPIETTMRYVANMDRFLASNEIFATGQNSGMIKFYGPGKEPPGWVPLQGRLAGPTPYQMRAYAPEGYARVYNRSAHVDPGMANSPGFRAVMQAKNAFTQTLLGFSGYHYLAMTQEAAASMWSRALGDLTDREFGEAAKKAGLTATLIGPAIRNLPKGRKLQKAYLNQLPANDPSAALYNRVASDLAAAGGRIVGRGEEWRGTAMSDYWTAWKRGTIGPEFRARLASVGMGPLSTAPLRAGSMFFSEVGRIMETINKPLFDHIVPWLKGGAFFDEMEAWLAKNPNASRTEEYAQANKLWQAVDDRFGEVVMDRIFWKQHLKQGLQAVMVSPGWELGSARAIGGGLTDIARGQWTPRARWIVAMSTLVPLTNAVYQYLRTGKEPESATDLVAPQTGGTTPAHMPERAILPGYEKDPLGWYKDPVGKIFSTTNPAFRAAREAVTGKDAFTGRPIVEDFPGADPWLTQVGKHILDTYTPIPVQQSRKGGAEGTALGPLSNVMGIRAAPGWITDPERTAAIEKSVRLNETIRSLSSQIYTAQNKGDRAEVLKLTRERAAAVAERKRVMGQEREVEERRKRSQPAHVSPSGL